MSYRTMSLNQILPSVGVFLGVAVQSVSVNLRSGGQQLKASVLKCAPKARSKPAARSCCASSGLPRKPCMTQGCVGRSCLRSINIRSNARTQWMVRGFSSRSESSTWCRKTLVCTGSSAPLILSKPHSPIRTTCGCVAQWLRLFMSSSMFTSVVHHGCIPTE